MVSAIRHFVQGVAGGQVGDWSPWKSPLGCVARPVEVLTLEVRRFFWTDRQGSSNRAAFSCGFMLHVRCWGSNW